MNKYTKVSIKKIHPELYLAFVEFLKKRGWHHVKVWEDGLSGGIAIYKDKSLYSNPVDDDNDQHIVQKLYTGDVGEAMRTIEEWVSKPVIEPVKFVIGTTTITIQTNGDVTYGCTTVNSEVVDMIIKERTDLLKKVKENS